ncbi:MAG TPA: exopolysaccharide transport family protein [Xanthobacteraceae bacterium]|nr:exopolysaccharide transport family protein [Xanthobacteraceae bacterium]
MFFKRKRAESPPPAPPDRAAVEPDGELDVRALGRALWRRKRAIIIPTIVVTALAAVAVHVITPEYKSSTTVLFDGRENIFLRPDVDKLTTDRGPADELALTSQVQLVLSRELALKVIKQLKLNQNPEFDPVLKGIPPWKYALILTGLVRNPLRQTAEERVLDSYFDRLTAFPLDRSRVFTIEFTSSDPKLAARAANAVADGYLELQQQARQQQTTAAAAWLQTQIDKLRPRVAEAEAKAEAFRGHTNLFLGTNNTNLSSQQLGEFNSQLALARGQEVDAQTRARIIRDMLKRGDEIEASDVLNSELIRRLSEQRVTLQAQLAEQSATLLDNHPRIRELKAQIADLDRQIRAEAEKVARSFENDAQIAAGRVTALRQNLDELKRQAVTTNEQGVQLGALDREAKSLRDLLESYLAKYREATARDTIGNAPPDTRIISQAVVSNTPYFPKKLPTILVAMLATLVISTGFVTTGELMRQSPALPVVPVVPAVPMVLAAAAVPPPPTAAVDVVLADSPLSRTVTHPALGVPLRAIDELAANLRAAGEGGRRIAVYGVSRHVGTTLSAVTLARALARNARVVLIDLAVGAPNLAAIAADPRAPGVAEIARGMASFGDVITRDKLSRVHLVNAGRIGADGPAIVASQRLATFIEALARAYDHVMIDAGATHEAPVERFARLAPRAVLVTTDEAAPATQVARDRLAAAGYGEIAVLDGAASAAAAVAA